MWAAIAATTLLFGCGRVNFVEQGAALDAAAPDSVPCTPAVVQLESILVAPMSMSATAAEVTHSVSLPLDRTLLFMSVREIEPTPTYGAVLCELVPTGIRCVRTAAGTDYAMSTGTIDIIVTAVTFATGVTVQRGVTAFQEGMATLTPVPMDSSFIVLTGLSNNTGNSWGTNEFTRAMLVDEQTIQVGTMDLSENVGWQVVTMAGARVQRGTRPLAPGETKIDIQLSPVDLGRTLPLISYTADSTNGLGTAWEMVTGVLFDATGLRLERIAATDPVDVAWEVITLPFAVEHRSATLLPTSLSAILTIPGATRQTAVALATAQPLFGPSTGRTSGEPLSEADLVGEAAVTLDVNTDNVGVQRSTGQSTSTFPFSVIDFARPTCGP